MWFYHTYVVVGIMYYIVKYEFLVFKVRHTVGYQLFDCFYDFISTDLQ